MGTEYCVRGGNGDDFLCPCSSLMGSRSELYSLTALTLIFQVEFRQITASLTCAITVIRLHRLCPVRLPNIRDAPTPGSRPLRLAFSEEGRESYNESLGTTYNSNCLVLNTILVSSHKLCTREPRREPRNRRLYHVHLKW